MLKATADAPDVGQEVRVRKDPIRLVDAGLVGPVRSQSVYHAVAHAMSEQTPDTIIIVGPTDPYV
jgi:hypothetical protein